MCIYRLPGMGGRKLRFDRRKNQERKRNAQKRESELVVSIPLALLPPPTDCVVSLPLSLYTSSNVSHAAALHMRLTKLRSIPTGWTILPPSSESPLVLFKLQCLPPLCTPQVVFSIQVLKHHILHNKIY